MSGYETVTRSEAPGPRNTDQEDVKIGYVLGTTVPKNWIPFIAVHAEGSVSEIRVAARPHGWRRPSARFPAARAAFTLLRRRTGDFARRTFRGAFVATGALD